MAVTFGFYNSRNGDRVYDAHQMSSIFSGIIADGVFENFPQNGNHFHAEWRSGYTGSQVVVGPGRAWLNDTWTDSDSDMFFSFDAPNPNQNIERVDAIVLEINTTNNSHTAANMSEAVPGRSNKFVVLKGQESGDPVKPALQNGNGIYQHYIALVRISANAQHQYVTNMVGAVDGTPYIVGAVREPLSTADVLDAWTQAFNAEIERFQNQAASAITDACGAYFNDPNSAIYQQINSLSDDIDAVDDREEEHFYYFSKRRHVWILDCPVSTIANYVDTYTKAPPSGLPIVPYTPVANPPHTIYPDFYNTIGAGQSSGGHIDPTPGSTYPLTSPNVGDIVIGSNGYYAVIVQWQLSGSAQMATYTMVIKSTGKAIVDAAETPLSLDFQGGHDRDGNDISTDLPAYCSGTFSEISTAYAAGRKINVHYWDGDRDQTYEEKIDGVSEYRILDGNLSEFVATFMIVDSNFRHSILHVYRVSASGVTEQVVTLN